MEALGCLASKPMWFTFVLHSFYGCISGHRSTLYPEIWSASWAIWHQGATKVIFHLIRTHSFIGPSANLKGPHNSSLIFIFYFLFWSCEGLKIKQIYSWYILEIFYPSQSSSKREERDSVSFLTNRMQQRTGKFSGRSKLLSKISWAYLFKYFSGLYFVPVMCVFIIPTISHCFDYLYLYSMS